jgi:hypothetical protein
MFIELPTFYKFRILSTCKNKLDYLSCALDRLQSKKTDTSIGPPVHYAEMLKAWGVVPDLQNNYDIVDYAAQYGDIIQSDKYAYNIFDDGNLRFDDENRTVENVKAVKAVSNNVSLKRLLDMNQPRLHSPVQLR